MALTSACATAIPLLLGSLVDEVKHGIKHDTGAGALYQITLLYLGLHDRWRAWKGFDWDSLDRLHAKGMISNPASKAKSVVFTDEGLREAERLFRELFQVLFNDRVNRYAELNRRVP